jgi:Tfp pilus assembly protein PilF
MQKPYFHYFIAGNFIFLDYKPHLTIYMGLFSKRSAPKPIEKGEINLTPEDKKWVDSCFKWFLKKFGYPAKDFKPFLFNAHYFPITFKAKKITVDNLLDDLCPLLSIDRKKVAYELVTDIRDISQTPYKIIGKVFESDLETITENDKKTYVIHIANSITQEEFLLLRRIIVELSEIKIREIAPGVYDGKDITGINYIAGIFFGCGTLISKALVEVGVQYRAGWQRTWRNKSEIPYQVIAYALASYSKLLGEDGKDWINELPADVKQDFDLAVEFLENNPDENTYFDAQAFENDLKAKAHQKLAESLRKENRYSEAFQEYELAISLASDKNLRTILFINSGYTLLFLDEYKKSLDYYKKALELRPGYDYAYANMGYIYTMTGEFDKAKEYLEKVNPYDKPLTAYLYRDWAIYYMKTGSNHLAEENFQKVFEMNYSVDLLEYFYAEFLLSKSEKAEAIHYLQLSIDKGEQKGIELMKSLEK